MRKNRREFLKMTGFAGISVAGASILPGFANEKNNTIIPNTKIDEKELSIIGLYGAWANSLNANKLPSFSFRSQKWPDLEIWRKTAKARVEERLAIPDIGGLPKVTVKKAVQLRGFTY